MYSIVIDFHCIAIVASLIFCLSVWLRYVPCSYCLILLLLLYCTLI